MRAALAIVLLGLGLSGCTIGRTYSGVPLRGDPARIVQGTSSRADVLEVLGPPDSIVHQTTGDAFIYRYRRTNSSSLTIREPFFLRQPIFSYNREFRAADTLVVLFDFHGVVQSIAHDQDTQDLPIL